MNDIWFTSDTHFGHERIITLCNRPFDSVDEMNETIIERWNAVVKPGDVVYHLGDVAMGTLADSLPLVNRLNGWRYLVPGNHDRIFSGNKQKYIDKFVSNYNVFDIVLPEIQTLWLGNPEHEFLLCHFPYEGDSHDEDRFADKRPVDEGLPLIHGHVHNAWRTNGRQFNVGVDVNDFTPVHLDTIVDWTKNADL